MTAPTFDEFFTSAMGLDPKKGGPHAYQRAIACETELPHLVGVPTGCGKTAAIVLGWLYRRFKHSEASVRQTTPRRLIYCLPMRTLVEQVRDNATCWLERLQLLAGNRGPDGRYRPDWIERRIPVFTLMGGEERVDWQAYPEREAILIGTQDMLLSRALNRGYGLYPAYWPMDFGLINVDSLWVLDEVQLMSVGRTTSAQLQLMAHQCSRHLTVPRRHTIWMSATLGSESGGIDGGRGCVEAPTWMRTPEHAGQPLSLLLQTLSANDIAPKSGNGRTPLQEVAHATKHLQKRLEGDEKWTGESDDLANAILNGASGRLILGVVNTVDRARAIYERLNRKNTVAAPDLVLLHSQFRPRDRAQVLARAMGDVPSNGRVVISTQVLEAGVDLDARRLFTELAPWPSLVQRFGRLNRRGRYDDAQVVVFDVPLDDAKAQNAESKVEREKALKDAQVRAARPYDWADIEKARKRLNMLDDRLPTLDQFENEPLPLEGPVLRRFHVEDAFDTDPDLSGGHTDVSSFVRARDQDLDVYVLWRQIAENPDDQPPPHPEEICPVPIYEISRVLRGKRAFRLAFGKKGRNRAWQRLTINRDSIRPGDTLMLDLDVGGYSEERGWLGNDVSNDAEKPKTYVARHDNRRAWVCASPGGVNVIADLDERVVGYSGRNRDPRSFIRRWMTLEEHLNSAQHRAEEILAELVCPAIRQRVALAARWHDVGKALERRLDDGSVARPFQEMLLAAGTAACGQPASGVLYAKSNGRGGRVRDSGMRLRPYWHIWKSKSSPMTSSPI